MDYRKDIDGLRAVAVLAVVLFHAKVPGFSGGFVGVDIFFVISGFLITGMIASDVAAGRFSFASFYHRRIRRIVPALLVIYVATTISASLLMLPSDMAEFGRSLFSSALFVSNVFFFNQAGYFDGPSELKPLLHTWSLSIEEQFYLAWPVLFLVIARWRRDLLPQIVWLAGALSVAAFVGMVQVRLDAAFFATPFRAWELMLGATLALMRARRPLSAPSADVCAGLGLLLIVLAVVAVDATHPLAILAALPACLGTALLIYSGQSTPLPYASRLLSTGPPVGVGLISYSLYLWHWPILAFARYALDRPLDWQEVGILISLSIVVAFLTHRFVEQPARRIDFSRMKPVIGGGLLALGAFALVGQQINRLGGWTFNLDSEIRQLDATARAENVYRRKCNGEKNAFRNDDVCGFGRPRIGSYDMVILGDSHANHFTPTMSLLARDANLSGRQITVGGCLALLGYYEIISPFATEPRCRVLREATVRVVEENPRLQVVVLAHRWSIYTGAPFSADETAPPFHLVGTKGDRHSRERSRAAMQQSLELTLDFFDRKNIHVVLLGEVPPLRIDPTRCIASAIKQHRTPSDCGRQEAEVRGILGDINALLSEQAKARKNVSFVSPVDMMCRSGWCSAIVDGVYMYRDSNHLNRLGAEHLSRVMRLPNSPNGQ